MGWAENTYGDTSGTYYWPSSSNSNINDIPRLNIKVQNEAERLFEKGKFFAFESSREFRAWFGSPRKPPEVHARHGFQQMSRIPCYRGVRTR